MQVEFTDNGWASEDERKRKREELDEKYASESTHGWRCLSQSINSFFCLPPPTESRKSISQSFSAEVIWCYSMCQSGTSVYLKSSGVARTSTQCLFSLTTYEFYSLTCCIIYKAITKPVIMYYIVYTNLQVKAVYFQMWVRKF